MKYKIGDKIKLVETIWMHKWGMVHGDIHIGFMSGSTGIIINIIPDKPKSRYVIKLDNNEIQCFEDDFELFYDVSKIPNIDAIKYDLKLLADAHKISYTELEEVLKEMKE